MVDAYAVFVEGISLGAAIGEIEPAILKAARASINTTAARGRTMAAQMIARQIAVPASYLAPGTGRLIVGKQATLTDLEANIQGRTRPTSLARFLVGSPGAGRQQGVQIAVKPGVARFLPRAFLLRLKSGSQNTDTTNNMGLAIRTNGSPPSAAYKPLQIAPGLYLLYGPSIDQVFKGADQRGVRDAIAPELSKFLSSEFDRLLNVELP